MRTPQAIAGYVEIYPKCIYYTNKLFYQKEDKGRPRVWQVTKEKSGGGPTPSSVILMVYRLLKDNT
jgi:hypothetical protein